MRGSGSHVWDADGNEYIDYILGMGPLILGHSPATVIEAVTRQLQDGLLFATPTDLEIEVAESLKALVPCAEKVRFGTSGSEAVHAALRLARAATGRPRILRFEGHYHGWLDNIAWEGAGGNGGGALKPSAAKGQIPSDSEGLLILPWNDLEAVGDLFRGKGSSIAAVILEPVMASCGAIPPTNGFLAGLHELCARHGSVLIFDEVVTGFRLALGGAQEFFGVTPDLAVFGKALGAGIPISAVAGGERVMRHWGEASPILAGTHSANPVSLAAARATLETLSADGGKLLLGMRETAAKLRSGLEALREQTSLPLTIRGVGPLLNVSFVPRDSSPITDHRSYLQTDFALTARLFDSLRARGVHVGHDGRWFLSSTHTDEDIQRTLAAMQSSLEELGAESTSSIRRPRGGGAFDGNGQAHKVGWVRAALSPLCARIHRRYQHERDRAYRSLEENHPRNYHWIVGWEVSHKCNLSCVYCAQDHRNGHPSEDFEKGLAHVLRIQPRLLWVTGGEPSLVPKLPETLRRIRVECGNPAILMSTNFQRPAAVFDEFAEVLDFLFITLDGVEEDNWTTRGFNGRKLLERLAEFIPRHPKLSITLTTVATVHNLDTLESFVDSVQTVLPGIQQYIWPMNPTFHPLSVGGSPETAARFAEIMERLSIRYPSIRGSTPKNKEARVEHGGNGSLLRRWLRDSDLVRCDRQYFYADIGADGLLMDCRLARIIPNLDHRANQALEKGQPLELYRALQLLRKQTRDMEGYNPVCSHPCTCVEGLGEVVLSSSREDPRLHSVPQLLGSRFRPEDRRAASEFIQRHINSLFEESFFDEIGPKAGRG
ncbi:MAG: Glutamate-1-semialdehyde 2,1-aminomutase [bacterium]|nr:Glutamate-1-semialdehyde 2,1-aminomutase [bacterium]